MTKVGLDAIGTSTTLESNKSLRPFLGAISPCSTATMRLEEYDCSHLLCHTLDQRLSPLQNMQGNRL